MEFCGDEGMIRYRYGSDGLSSQILKSERNSKEKVVGNRAEEECEGGMK